MTRYQPRTCPTCGEAPHGRAVATVAEWQQEHDDRTHRDLAPGDGVTETLWTDTQPYVVVDVAKNGNAVTLVQMAAPAPGVGRRADPDGPFPVITYTYGEEERAEVVARWRQSRVGDVPERIVTARRRKDGRWYLAGGKRPLVVNRATYHRDYRD